MGDNNCRRAGTISGTTAALLHMLDAQDQAHVVDHAVANIIGNALFLERTLGGAKTRRILMATATSFGGDQS